MRILAVDFGESKIGLAISDGPLAEPLGVIKSKESERKIARICKEHEIEKIVVGASSGKIFQKQEKFAEKLKDVTGLLFEFQDESLTTQEALIKMREAGKRVRLEDAISAALILQAYLDKQDDV